MKSYTSDRERMVGCWGLVAQVYEDVETGERVPIFGDKPRGRQIATPDGRWIALATAEGRPIPADDAERAKALQTMIAYTGRYRFENGKVTTRVEAAWNEAWVGSDQLRHVTFDGDDLINIVSAPMPHPNLPGRKVKVVVTWRREEHF